jgi:hypothetical protein
MLYRNMSYGGHKRGKCNRFEIFRQIFCFLIRLLDYSLYLCLNHLPTNCQDGFFAGQSVFHNHKHLIPSTRAMCKTWRRGKRCDF